MVTLPSWCTKAYVVEMLHDFAMQLPDMPAIDQYNEIKLIMRNSLVELDEMQDYTIREIKDTVNSFIDSAIEESGFNADAPYHKAMAAMWRQIVEGKQA